MWYLLWAILNIGLSLSFLFLCFRATKLIRERRGVVAAIVFVCGLLSFANHPGKEAQKLGEQFDFSLTENNADAANPAKRVFVTLDDNLLFSTDLEVAYAVDTSRALLVPTRASSTMNGFIAGHRWQALSISATAQGSTIHYTVYGRVDWKLLNFTIYRQAKMYTGAIATSEPVVPYSR